MCVYESVCVCVYVCVYESVCVSACVCVCDLQVNENLHDLYGLHKV